MSQSSSTVEAAYAPVFGPVSAPTIPIRAERAGSVNITLVAVGAVALAVTIYLLTRKKS